MLERGIYAPAMRPPTVPEGKSRVRITVSAAHEEEDMDLAAEILAQSAGKAGAA
jgi:7-keto-8-aminopelargonate synthetase-like enzyme